MVFWLLSAAPLYAAAPTVEKLVDLHLKALGGARALASVNSVRLAGTANGSGEFLWQSQKPDAYYLEVRRGGVREIDAVRGGRAWRDDAGLGMRTLVGSEQSRARALASYRNHGFLDYKKKRTRVTLGGSAVVEGRPVLALEVIDAAGVQRRVYFDTTTWLIAKEEQKSEGVREEIFFGDYRPVNGVQEPHRIRIHRGEDNLDLVVQSAAHNESVDRALFEFPKGDATTMPDFPSLLKAVVENQKLLEKARGDYTYTKTQNEIETDDAGRVKAAKERTYEVFFLNGREIERLVARDGQPLPAAEARKEDERIEMVIQKARERERKAAEKAASSGAQGSRRKSVSLTLSQVLRVVRFVNPRRERFRGKDALVYDFEARPDARPVDRAESWIQKLSGTMWMDEIDKGVLRAEARMTEGIKMAGGLVFSVQSGSSFVFEQEFVRGEVWLPSYTEVNASGRILLLKGFKVHQKERFSNYRKFQVDTFSEIKPPRLQE